MGGGVAPAEWRVQRTPNGVLSLPGQSSGPVSARQSPGGVLSGGIPPDIMRGGAGVGPPGGPGRRRDSGGGMQWLPIGGMPARRGDGPGGNGAAGTVPGITAPGMVPPSMVPPDIAPPIGGTILGGTVYGGTVWCRRWAARYGAAYWRHGIRRHGEWCRPVGRHGVPPGDCPAAEAGGRGRALRGPAGTPGGVLVPGRWGVLFPAGRNGACYGRHGMWCPAKAGHGFGKGKRTEDGWRMGTGRECREGRLARGIGAGVQLVPGYGWREGLARGYGMQVNGERLVWKKYDWYRKIRPGNGGRKRNQRVLGQEIQGMQGVGAAWELGHKKNQKKSRKASK